MCLLVLLNLLGLSLITQQMALLSGLFALPSMDLVDPEVRLRSLT